MSRSGIQLCYPFEEKRLPGSGWVNSWNQWPVLVQPKLDGERCRAVYDWPGDWHLISSELNHFESIPHITKALHQQKIPYDLELDGELYTHGMDFNEIHSRVGRTVNLHPDHGAIEFHIFDIVNAQPQHRRINWLSKMHLKHPLMTVPVLLCNTFDEIMRAYDKIIEQGYEGIIVRHIDAPYVRKRSTFMLKFKPKKDDYYEITGFGEEVSIHGKPKGALGFLECQGAEGNTFSVGSGFTRDQRQDYWNKRETLVGKLCHVQYQHITSGKGVPRFPVFIEVIEGDPLNF